MSGIELASSQSIRAFRSSEEYLDAMKEDLAEWLNDLYGTDMTVDSLVQMLQTGSLLCTHANRVTAAAAEYLHRRGGADMQPWLPTSEVSFMDTARPNTFQARDNVSNFIRWCRTQMHIKDVLMFETDDLVLKKNEKNVVLCLLEVARRASRFGMAAPVLIQLEQEIDEELREENRESPKPAVQRCPMDTQRLDNMVQHLISRCTCPTQFPMVKLSDGKYRVGDSSVNIFVRILRQHVMVRVGGGWDTLEHYLDKHDPCRCTSLIHKLAPRPATPIHEIKSRQFVTDGQTGSRSSLLLSRVRSPIDPVVWSPSGPPRTSRSEPVLRNKSSLNKLRQSKDDMALGSTSRPGRDSIVASPSPRVPRAARTSTPTQPETRRPSTPLVFHKVNDQTCLGPPQGHRNNTRGQTWTRSQLVSKLRRNATVVIKGNREGREFQETGVSPLLARSLPSEMSTASQHSQRKNAHQAKVFSANNVTQHPPQISTKDIVNSDHIRTFCPSRGQIKAVLGESNENGQSANSTRQVGRRNIQGRLSNGDQKQNLEPCSATETGFSGTSPVPHSIANAKIQDLQMRKRFLFTPPPISPAQEAMLYQSLEEEILSNLQRLEMDSDSGDSSADISPQGSSSWPTSRHGAPFIGALSKETAPLSRRTGTEQESPSRSEPKPPPVAKHSATGSWSSLASSTESRGSIHPADSSSSAMKWKERPRGSSLGKRRSLRKPERVPSIYKLKLRPCARPRRDHRPDKGPTRIPKPVFYRQSQSPKDVDHSNTRKEPDGGQIRRSSTWRCSKKRTTKGRGTVQDKVTDQEVEYWV